MPQNVGARDELYGYVDALRDWRGLLSEPWAVVMMSERAGEVLAECGRYPFFERLKELFRGYEIEEYDANTVYKMACGLLTHTPSFEEYYRVKDVLADSVDTCPDVLAEIEQGPLRTEMERCVLLLAILKKHGVPAGEHQCMVWGGIPGGRVGVRGEVHYVEHDRADLGVCAAGRLRHRNGSPAHALSFVSGRLRRSAGRGRFSTVGEQEAEFVLKGRQRPPCVSICRCRVPHFPPPTPPSARGGA